MYFYTDKMAVVLISFGASVSDREMFPEYVPVFVDAVSLAVSSCHLQFFSKEGTNSSS